MMALDDNEIRELRAEVWRCGPRIQQALAPSLDVVPDSKARAIALTHIVLDIIDRAVFIPKLHQGDSDGDNPNTEHGAPQSQGDARPQDADE